MKNSSFLQYIATFEMSHFRDAKINSVIHRATFTAASEILCIFHWMFSPQDLREGRPSLVRL